MFLHVVGARPNFMKAAPVVEALGSLGLEQIVVHTGQHYDKKMSDVFFDQLGLPEPTVNLGVGSSGHAEQTGRIMQALEPILIDTSPDWLVVYGDVNSTIAAALTAAKLGIPIAHVEAGLRSFDRTMPEEINRILTDALASLLLTTSPEAEDHLTAEGAIGRVEFVGNPMIDTLFKVLDSGRVPDGSTNGQYGLVTLHRPANVDDMARLSEIVSELQLVAETLPLRFPVHPRGKHAFEASGWVESERMMTMEPVGYLEFVSLMRDARLVITDSGGIQEETTMLGVPCVTVRPNTERPITITKGTNQLVEPEALAATVSTILDGSWKPTADRPPLWDGKAGVRIAAALSEA